MVFTVMNKIFIINPGSTSTKLAMYCGNVPLWTENCTHEHEDLSKYAKVLDQLDMRYQILMETLDRHEEDPATISAVAARGGLLPPPVASGAYEVNETMLDVLANRPLMEHASNLGAVLAYRFAEPLGIKAYIYDAVTVDEMVDLARVTGLKDIVRYGKCHNLNMRAAALDVCSKSGDMNYYTSNIIVAHVGGGVSTSLHSNGRIIDICSDDEEAFSAERAGGLPSYRLLQLVFERGYTYSEAMRLLQCNGGLMSHFGTSDTREVEKRALSGDAQAKLVFNAMALSVARSILKLSAIVNGKVDCIVLTGGVAYSEHFTAQVLQRVKFLSPVRIVPGEHEMEALAKGVGRVLDHTETPNHYA